MEPPSKTTVIGLLGGIASGKSVVADALVRRGAVLLDADKAGHEVLCEPEVKAAARSRWGNAIFDANGEIHRPALAKIVFAPPPHGPAELRYLESITHPRIGIRLQERLEKLATADRPSVVVLDAPVMLKAGWDRFCTHLVFVDTPREIRLQRALARGWTEADFDRREAAQEPVDRKRHLAGIVIDNSGSLAATEAQVEAFWRQIAGRSS